MVRIRLVLLLVGVAGCSGESEQPLADGGPSAVDAGEDVRDAAPACRVGSGEPQKKALFTRTYPDKDYAIENEVVALIDAAVPGSRIRIAIFTWTRLPVVDALMRARARGVDVRVVVDESNQVEDPEGSGAWRYNDAVSDLLEGLGADRVTVCNAATPPDGGGCIGRGINHNKIALFSELCDGSTHVVTQASANYTNTQLRNYNNMVVIRGDVALFDGYEQYWRDLDSEVQNADYYRKTTGDTGTRAYFFPRATGDTVYNILTDNVDCAAGSRVRVGMAFWTNARSNLVDALAELRAHGCDVKVIASADAAADVIPLLRSALSSARVSAMEGVHHKFLLIDSRYAGSATPRRLVFTGSHNYTGNALRANDETLLRVEDDAVFDAFDAEWQRLWDSAE